jgi:HEAT repeat protein
MTQANLHQSVLFILSLLLSCTLAVAAEPAQSNSVPDLTKTIDFERKGEYFLGPTGLKGWMFVSDNFMTAEARQILITHVSPGSAADGMLKVGDVILGVDGKYFDSDARKSFGRAIDEAERSENRGILKLIRWRPTESAKTRQGTETKVQLTLKVMGTYSDMAPYNCPKSKRILADAIKNIIERKDMGRFGAAALALLATGEQEHLEIVRDYLHEVRWAKPDMKISLESGGLVAWSYGYQNLVLTEYYLASGDEYVLPAIREYSIKTAMGQSNGGTWGHGLAWTSKNDGKLHGRLGGYGAVNQAGLPCFLSLLLAKKCGVEHPEVDDAISRASRFFQQFIDKGSIGYGYHRPSLEINANGRNGMSGNGKNGIAAVAFQVQGHREGTRFFSKLTASLYNTCEYGHSGNSYSYFWDPLGANSGGPELAAAFLKELRWYYALTRQADGSFVNQPLGGHYGGKMLDPTIAQVLIATMPRKAIHLTGKSQKKGELFDKQETEDAIAAGRWRLANADNASADELIGELDNWSPIAREWIAIALAKKKDKKIVPQLVQLLESDNPEARAGAAAGLGYQGDRAANVIPQLSKLLNDKEPIVCMTAGYALARIGQPAQKAIPELLRALLASQEEELMKPKRQALAYSFGYASGKYAPLYFDGILAQVPAGNNPLGELDRDLLYPAIAKLLSDSSGRTRECGAYALNFFDRRDTAAMAQEIYDTIKTPAMNYLMMDDGPRAYGLQLMARLRLKEGIPLCIETIEIGRWGSHTRVPARFKTLQAYGGNAKSYLPQLREMRTVWKSGDNRIMLDETIKIIEDDNNPFPLTSIHDLVDERLARDLAEIKNDERRLDFCRELAKKHPNDFFYRAAGIRKVVSIRGGEAFNELLAALSNPNEIIHETVVKLSADLPGNKMTDKWIRHLDESESNRLAGILDVLGQRKDPKTLPAVNKYLKHEDEIVRNAALRAASALEVK